MFRKSQIYIAIAFLLCVKLSFSQVDSVNISNLYYKKGLASFYAKKFEGRKTANGERYRRKLLTAAHRTLPLNSKVKVTNPKNGKWVIVRINDRGPYNRKRIIDLSRRAAKHLGLLKNGVGMVIVEQLPDSVSVWYHQSVK
jgi:rare lipoprotein A